MLFLRKKSSIFRSVLFISTKLNLFSHKINELIQLSQARIYFLHSTPAKNIWYGTHTSFSYLLLEQKKILLSALNSYSIFIFYALQLKESSAFTLSMIFFCIISIICFERLNLANFYQ